MRVKRGTVTRKKHKRLLAQTKGMSHIRRSSVKKAREAVLRSLAFSYRDRRNRKRDFRRLWISRINAALTKENVSYSKFMAALKAAEINLNRKTLAELASNEPRAFEAVVKAAKK